MPLGFSMVSAVASFDSKFVDGLTHHETARTVSVDVLVTPLVVVKDVGGYRLSVPDVIVPVVVVTWGPEIQCLPHALWRSPAMLRCSER